MLSLDSLTSSPLSFRLVSSDLAFLGIGAFGVVVVLGVGSELTLPGSVGGVVGVGPKPAPPGAVGGVVFGDARLLLPVGVDASSFIAVFFTRIK